MPGRVPASKVPGVLAKAQALLVSDPAMSLTVPSKLQTCLAAGKPIIAALDGEGARVVTEAGAGVTCAAGDANALAECAQRLAAMDAAEGARMGQSGAPFHARHCTPQVLTPRLVQHLESAVRYRRASR